MARRKQESDDFDSPWKEALQAYLPHFLAFFFPDICADIDWTRGFQALDKEFQQIVRRAEVGKCLADKLFKVWLKEGVEHWLLIHIEIQGEYEKKFPERMYEYNSAARKLYNQTVVSLAVLCDDNPNWRPTNFSYGRWGCQMELTFRSPKLLDHVADWAALEASDNPFAAVVQAHWQARQTRDDAVSRWRDKMRLVKGLFEKKWTKDQIRKLFRLIDWIMTLPEGLEESFRTEIYQFEQEKNMPYLSSFERWGFKKGLEEGREKGLEEGREKGLEEGREKGREEGLEKGREEGLLQAISLLLEDKFGKPSLKLLGRVRNLDLAELQRLVRFLPSAKTLQEVRAHLTSAR